MDPRLQGPDLLRTPGVDEGEPYTRKMRRMMRKDERQAERNRMKDYLISRAMILGLLLWLMSSPSTADGSSIFASYDGARTWY